MDSRGCTTTIPLSLSKNGTDILGFRIILQEF